MTTHIPTRFQLPSESTALLQDIQGFKPLLAFLKPCCRAFLPDVSALYAACRLGTLSPLPPQHDQPLSRELKNFSSLLKCLFVGHDIQGFRPVFKS
jgi:hypothetical protein